MIKLWYQVKNYGILVKATVITNVWYEGGSRAMQELDITVKSLEQIKRRSKNNVEYWMARDLQKALTYDDWRNFQDVINKAKKACEGSGENIQNHFVESTKMVKIGSGASRVTIDYFLSRYACYLIAMNADSSKQVIATAQTYFAYQTRKQEVQDKLTEDEKRILLRNKVKNDNKKLASVAKEAGVRSNSFGIFQDAGYKGLYGGLGLKDIKQYKGLTKKDDLLDRSGRAELAANHFRITQTEQKLIRDKINAEQTAIDAHYEVGGEVRKAIERIGGTMPENLSPEPSIKILEKDRKKKSKQLPK